MLKIKICHSTFHEARLCYFMVYRHFWVLLNVGIRNKNKNKIPVMSDMHWWSTDLLGKIKSIFTLIEKLTIQGDRKLNSRNFDTK